MEVIDPAQQTSQGNTTDEMLRIMAFDDAHKESWAKAGFTTDYRRHIRYNINHGIKMSKELKEGILVKLNCQVIQEEMYELPRKRRKAKTVQNVRSNSDQ